MTSLFLLLPISLLFVIGIGVAFWWAIFAGQFDDTDAAAMSILQDEDGPDQHSHARTQDLGHGVTATTDRRAGERGENAAVRREDRPA